MPLCQGATEYIRLKNVTMPACRGYAVGTAGTVGAMTLFRHLNSPKNVPLDRKPICPTVRYAENKFTFLQQSIYPKIHTLPAVVLLRD